MTETLARGIVAHGIMSKWRPFILAPDPQAADWLAHDLCLENEWQFLERAGDLLDRRDATVLVLEDWRHGRDMKEWIAIERALKAQNAYLVHIPPKDKKTVRAWFQEVVEAFDAIRVRPRLVQT